MHTQRVVATWAIRVPAISNVHWRRSPWNTSKWHMIAPAPPPGWASSSAGWPRTVFWFFFVFVCVFFVVLVSDFWFLFPWSVKAAIPGWVTTSKYSRTQVPRANPHSQGILKLMGRLPPPSPPQWLQTLARRLHTKFFLMWQFDDPRYVGAENDLTPSTAGSRMMSGVLTMVKHWYLYPCSRKNWRNWSIGSMVCPRPTVAPRNGRRDNAVRTMTIWRTSPCPVLQITHCTKLPWALLPMFIFSAVQ